MNDLAKNTLDRKMQRIEAMIESLEKLSNPAARIVAQELVQTLLTLHGAGLARMLEITQQTGGEAAIAAWGLDDLVSNLLMLHGMHPVSLETRARQAIEQVQPVLRCSGGELELVAVTERLVRVRLRGTSALSPQELEHTLEEAFAAIAPDVRVIEVENTATPAQRIGLPVVSHE
jgi:Fe-S cluster biogenesis protein NfuA